MKESGLNYFYNELTLNTGFWDVLYTFEEGVGTNINSISGAQNSFNGTLTNSLNFWQKPGSGFFNGNPVIINNASGLFSNTWTMFFAYEKINTNNAILFSSINNNSGFQIGLTDSNKPYFLSPSNQQVIVACDNNFSSKNLISFSYLPNYLTIGYYNFTSQEVEAEFFNYNFNLIRSDNWNLGPSYTGYMDYFGYFSTYYDQNILSQLFSGIYNYPMGIGYNIQTTCSSGITGYQNVSFITTGITGYTLTTNPQTGDYAGVFPVSNTLISLTGIISNIIILSGITGTNCIIQTGSSFTQFEILSGYASSYGMQKIQLFEYLQQNDVVKDSYSYNLFDNNYNYTSTFNFTGFYLNQLYTTGQINIFLNSIGEANSGWYITGNYLIFTGCSATDLLFFDTATGNKNMFTVSGGLITFPFNYIGQEIFLNGINLISGYSFSTNDSSITLLNPITGINGYIFEYPIILNFNTGNYNEKTVNTFSRNTSNVYLNGARQQINIQYVEGAIFDNLSGNYYNNLSQTIIYDDNNNYWNTF